MTTPNTPDNGIGLYDGVEAISNLANLMDPEMDIPEEQAETVTDEVSVSEEEQAYEASELEEETDEHENELSEEEEQPEVYSVRVNGEDVEVTFDELTKGYSRESDYRRKTQDVAEQRKTVEKQIQEAQAQFQRSQQLEQQYAELLPQLAQQLQADVQGDINWEEAYQADPIEAMKLERQHKAQQEAKATKLQAIQAEQQRLMQSSQQSQQAQYQQHLAEQAQLLPELIPAWSDEKVKADEVALMRKWAVDSGRVSADQINRISDAGHVALLRDAWKFSVGEQRVNAKRKATTSKKGRAVRPGSKATPNAKRTAAKNAAGKLKQTGSYRDAADLLMTLDLD